MLLDNNFQIIKKKKVNKNYETNEFKWIKHFMVMN